MGEDEGRKGAERMITVRFSSGVAEQYDTVTDLEWLPDRVKLTPRSIGCWSCIDRVNCKTVPAGSCAI